MLDNLIERIRTLGTERLVDRQFAWELYCSLCNRVWMDNDYNEDDFRIFFQSPDYWENWSDEKFANHLSFSWRKAGGIISECFDSEPNYMKFYCCTFEGGISEGDVTDRARAFWDTLGYRELKRAYAH